ncbi:MAG: DUF1080 domain-containing protein [Candidatus Solibacter sp.]|nr:DUF1080 domain-containing protein [Candidatus Solibacter sp.]
MISRYRPAALAACLLAVLAGGLRAEIPQAAGGAQDGEWKPMFDGKTLAGWKESDFLGAGKVAVADGVITIGPGVLTGITWAGERLPFPATGYEVRVEAARLRGGDFFAGITFPVGDTYCSWINGGWGGEVVGLSNIDGADAARNETTVGITFETGRWYVLRLRVMPKAITAWIDDDKVIDVSIEKKWIALREGDIDRSVPFGIATYATMGGVRKIEWRPVKPEEK